jgi:hypothetical protein
MARLRTCVRGLGHREGLAVTLVATPVVVPVAPFVMLVMPLLGSLLAPMAAIRVETGDGEAKRNRANGQEEKTAFHVRLLGECVVL